MNSTTKDYTLGQSAIAILGATIGFIFLYLTMLVQLPFGNIVRGVTSIIILALVSIYIYKYEKQIEKSTIPEESLYETELEILKFILIFLIAFLTFTAIWFLIYGYLYTYHLLLFMFNAGVANLGFVGFKKQAKERGKGGKEEKKSTSGEDSLKNFTNNIISFSFFYSMGLLGFLVLTWVTSDFLFNIQYTIYTLQIFLVIYIIGFVLVGFYESDSEHQKRVRVLSFPLPSQEHRKGKRVVTFPPRAQERMGKRLPVVESPFLRRVIPGESHAITKVRPKPIKEIEKVNVSRGGEFIGNRMRYKIKVSNESEFIITDVTIYLISYPDESLRLENEEHSIHFPKIKPGNLERASFDFLPTKDCVRGEINAGVSYVDMMGKVHTLSTKSFTIRSVCDLLLPERITPEDFKLKLKELDCGEVVLKIVEWSPEEMFVKSLRIVDESNFFEVKSELEDDTGIVYAKIIGFAQGKYTRKDVAVEINITGPKGMKGATCTIRVSGEDQAMIMPTIDDLRERLNAWLCPQCGSPLTLANVEALREGKVIECPFCSISIGR